MFTLSKVTPITDSVEELYVLKNGKCAAFDTMSSKYDNSTLKMQGKYCILN